MKYTDKQLELLESPEIKCSDIEDVMGDYVDGEMPASLKDRVHDHIIRCEGCQKFSWSYGKTVELARELSDRPIPLDVQRRLRMALNDRLGLNMKVDEERV